MIRLNPKEIIRKTREQILAEIPDPGAGLNTGLLVAARKLKECGYSPDRVIDILLPIANERRGRDCLREVTRQVETAFNSTGEYSSKPKLAIAHYQPGLWREAGIQEASLADLYEASPIKWDDSEPHSEEVIDALFPGNPWLCCGQTAYAFETRRREDFRGLLSQLSFIVPNVAISKTGATQEGYESEHALSQFPTPGISGHFQQENRKSDQTVQKDTKRRPRAFSVNSDQGAPEQRTSSRPKLFGLHFGSHARGRSPEPSKARTGPAWSRQPTPNGPLPIPVVFSPSPSAALENLPKAKYSRWVIPK
jgi:hypothetical protein